MLIGTWSPKARWADDNLSDRFGDEGAAGHFRRQRVAIFNTDARQGVAIGRVGGADKRVCYALLMVDELFAEVNVTLLVC